MHRLDQRWLLLSLVKYRVCEHDRVPASVRWLGGRVAGVGHVPLKLCIEAGCNVLTSGTRCTDHQRQWKRWRNQSAKAAADQVKREPRCSVCGATDDLTAQHPIPRSKGGAPEHVDETLCRRHNSQRGTR
jgi:5-methylcytosine-specific restriction endonuclease McrA